MSVQEPEYDEFDAPVDDRYFEDYEAGRRYRFGTESVDHDEIVAYGHRYDPQSIHTDAEAAAAGPFGGLIASGWQTAGLMMRLFADYYLTSVASLASPGIDELRWVRPVRPGDRLDIVCETVETRASRSKPDRGIVITDVTMLDGDDQTVLTLRAMNMVARRGATTGE